jgi:hypothetical protein
VIQTGERPANKSINLSVDRFNDERGWNGSHGPPPKYDPRAQPIFGKATRKQVLRKRRYVVL